jgi:hypothetical protein
MNDSRAELGQHEVAVGRPLNPRTTVEQSRSTSGRTRGRNILGCRSEHGRLLRRRNRIPGTGRRLIHAPDMRGQVGSGVRQPRRRYLDGL